MKEPGPCLPPPLPHVRRQLHVDQARPHLEPHPAGPQPPELWGINVLYAAQSLVLCYGSRLTETPYSLEWYLHGNLWAFACSVTSALIALYQLSPWAFPPACHRFFSSSKSDISLHYSISEMTMSVTASVCICDGSESWTLRNIILRHPSRLSWASNPLGWGSHPLGLSLRYSLAALACWFVSPCMGTSLRTARMYFSFLCLHPPAVW